MTDSVVSGMCFWKLVSCVGGGGVRWDRVKALVVFSEGEGV